MTIILDEFETSSVLGGTGDISVADIDSMQDWWDEMEERTREMREQAFGPFTLPY